MRLLLATLLLSSCASIPSGAAFTVTSGSDPRVGTYVSKPWGFETSSYWLEGPTGLVLVDTQFLPSAAIEAVEWAEQLTGKQVIAAIVLHPNPDKFNGAAVLAARGVEILSSKQVVELIPGVHEGRKRSFYARYQPDYPAEAPRVAAFGDGTATIERAGLSLKLHVLGPGASRAHVVLEWEGHVFPGDLVTNDGHAWLELGEVPAWIDRLDEILKLEPKHVHPGRGPSGDRGLLVAQRAYLEHVLHLVDTQPSIERATEAVIAAFPGYGLPIFVELGMPQLWKRRHPSAP